MKPTWTKTSRYFILFSAGVLAVAATLGTFGFRSFRYEAALLSRQQAEQAGSVALELERNGEGFFEEMARSFARARNNGAGDRLVDLGRVYLRFDSLNGVPVSTALLYDADDRLRFPVNAGNVPAVDFDATMDWGANQTEMSRLERVELIERKPLEAAEGYERLLETVTRYDRRTALLKYMAAAYRKAGAWEKAESAYRRLIEEYGEAPDPAGVPSGVVAYQLLASGYDERKSAKASDVRVKFAEDLIFGRWSLTAETRERLLNETIAKLEPGSATAARLQEEAAALRRRQENFSFSRAKAGELATYLRSQGAGERTVFLRTSRENEKLFGRDALVVAGPC